MHGETSRCRERLKEFCVGYGIDVGYGGDPIVPGAITIDLPQPYTKVGDASLNLGGDARDLRWFADNSLNFVYSSHLLEDFEAHETKVVLLEWLRVLTVGGYLILYLPDEQKYRKHCKATGQDYNCAHKIENFSLDYIKSVLEEIPGIEIVHENPACEDYSFEVVIRKTGSSDIRNLTKKRREEETKELRKSLVEKDDYIKSLEQTIFRMMNTRGWRMLERVRKIRNRFFPLQR